MAKKVPSRRVASLAARALRNRKSSRALKSLAGSVLSQREKR